jgi:ChrR Cupin-like domain
LFGQGILIMTKSARVYWNPLDPANREDWIPTDGLDGRVEELTLSIDDVSGEYTRLTRFHPGADTASLGSKSHEYPEEVFIVSGSLYDEAFDQWLAAGHYASRPPGEVHGPFKTQEGCVVLEISFPNKVDE